MSPGIKLGTLHTEGHVLANCVTLAPSIIFGIFIVFISSYHVGKRNQEMK